MFLFVSKLSTAEPARPSMKTAQRPCAQPHASSATSRTECNLPSPSSEGGLESLPKASFFPVSLAIRELAAQAKGQGGGIAPRKSRAHPGECGLKNMNVPCLLRHSTSGNPDAASQGTGSMTQGSMHRVGCTGMPTPPVRDWAPWKQEQSLTCFGTRMA